MGSLGVEQHVKFLGYIPSPEVKKLMRRSKLFVFPSTLKARPFTLLETMGCAAPIVASSAGPMRELAQDAVLYFDPADPDQLAAEDCRIVEDDVLRRDQRFRNDLRPGSGTLMKLILRVHRGKKVTRIDEDHGRFGVPYK